SDASGFFQLRLFATQDGAVKGDLRVTPPAPYPPYVVTGVSLNTSRTRGDGGYLGRLVVNPFLILVGDVYDRRTRAPVSGATITLRRISGAHLSPDTITLVSDAGARVAWIEPTIVEFGVFKADVELSAPGYPRPFHIERDIPIS